ncbi:hypothetical protein Mtc_0008 [Methanocella conradii HZ254]|uniref:Uncharacterized protein n=1 Tax=Methanocella conradii (strain DSM 24694 / JCM 17849 / CGMCC 1.5162 / HZ254) TaxID=1041930 RepID=H8I524_METCZ|nr:hypothetical protein [Methanocella conradii]AFC98783.1 hypothetical protein Mtc_0008 [Methanocella conradii HZ254]
MAKDNGKSLKKATKKEPTNWAKAVIPILLVVIMLGSIFAYVLSNPVNTSNTSKTTSNEKPFNSIMDGLKLLPANLSSARYADLKGDTVLSQYMYNNAYLARTIPPSKTFSADPQKDMLAIYPPGYFGDFQEQFVSLTSFGSSRINSSYTAYDVNGQTVEMVNNKYFYTLNLKPVISGRIENVAKVLESSGNESAYNEYSDLFEELKWKQISTDNATLETVGKSCSYASADRYYAALWPADPKNSSQDRPYSYVAIIHVNHTLADSEYADLASYGASMTKYGFSYYNVQVYDDYIVIEAEGSLDVCMDDALNRWSFIKYKLS